MDKTLLRPVIIAALANDFVVSRLINGASSQLKDQNSAEVIRVPGALEIPLALKKAATSGLYNCFVVLGAVIKGQTDHYDHVARMANDGVLQVALEHSLALGNGILTVHTMEHALARADGPAGNLGKDAMLAALSLSQVFSDIDQKKQSL